MDVKSFINLPNFQNSNKKLIIRCSFIRQLLSFSLYVKCRFLSEQWCFHRCSCRKHWVFLFFLTGAIFNLTIPFLEQIFISTKSPEICCSRTQPTQPSRAAKTEAPRAISMKPSWQKLAELTTNSISASESGLGWIPREIMKIDRGKWCCFLPVIVTTCFRTSLLWFAVTFSVMAQDRADLRDECLTCLLSLSTVLCRQSPSCLWYWETAARLLNCINHIQHDRLLLLSFKRFSKASCSLPRHNSSCCFSSVTFPGPPPTASPGSS